MTNEEILGIMNDADEVMESIDHDPFGMNILQESNVTITIDNLKDNLNSDRLKDPLIVAKLKKDIQKAKNWDKVLNIIQKLNVIVAGGALIGGEVKNITATDAMYAADALNKEARANNDSFLAGASFQKMHDSAGGVHNAKVAMVTTILINVAIGALTPLLKMAIRNKEISNISAVKDQVDSSIKLYEKQIKNITSESEKKKLQDAIDRLKDLKETMDSESERLNIKDNEK